jgi:plasmid stabilization system protein ParE
MRVYWTPRAFADVDRVREFLARKNPRAASAAAEALFEAPNVLLDQPRIGARLERFVEQEARRLVVGKYEIWYALIGDEIQVLRVFHTKEDR